MLGMASAPEIHLFLEGLSSRQSVFMAYQAFQSTALKTKQITVVKSSTSHIYSEHDMRCELVTVNYRELRKIARTCAKVQQ